MGSQPDPLFRIRKSGKEGRWMRMGMDMCIERMNKEEYLVDRGKEMVGLICIYNMFSLRFSNIKFHFHYNG